MTNLKIGFIGLGLIGSSLALCIKKEYKDIKIYGFDINKQSALEALELNIIDEISLEINQLAKSVDMIFLCSPIRASLEILKQINSLNLKEKILISDVGSTKQEIIKLANSLQNIRFLGGHPMAGSHKSGVKAARDTLFENAYYLVIKSRSSKDEDIDFLKELLKASRAKFLCLDAKEHDKITGMLSHFPHIIASSLVNQTSKFLQDFPQGYRLAAGGFRDITRIASANPTMWSDILLTNNQILISIIEDYQNYLEEIKQNLIKNDQEYISNFFKSAKTMRDSLPSNKKGAIVNFWDLFVQIPDYPGVIAQVTSVLADKNLSLINIRILEVREDIYGVLQLTFKDFNDRVIAKQAIESSLNYQCLIKD